MAADSVHAVTFAENHDTQPGQALQSFVQTWVQARRLCAHLACAKRATPACSMATCTACPTTATFRRCDELPLLMEIRRRFCLWHAARLPRCARCDRLDARGRRRARGQRRGRGAHRPRRRREAHVRGRAPRGETWSCVVGEQDDVVVDAEGWATFRTLGGRLSVYLPETTADALEHDRELQPHRSRDWPRTPRRCAPSRHTRAFRRELRKKGLRPKTFRASVRFAPVKIGANRTDVETVSGGRRELAASASRSSRESRVLSPIRTPLPPTLATA